MQIMSLSSERRENLKRLLACATVLLPNLVGVVATLSIGVTEKSGMRQVLGRVDYVSWSTLPINHPNVNFRGHTRPGVERPVEGGLALG